MNSDASHYTGQRLSLKCQRFTIRYIGEVAGKTGKWLGVEWDNSQRGKHDGYFEGVRYFTCQSRAATAASFIRPGQTWDKPVSFLAALRQKYIPEYDAIAVPTIYFSAKQAEEVGFDKFARRQAELRGIHVIVLDQTLLQLPALQNDEAYPEADEIKKLCSHITTLDLSRNLIESTVQVHSFCAFLPNLKQLTLDGNRFKIDSHSVPLPRITSLSLSETLVPAGDAVNYASLFQELRSLTLANNETTTISTSVNSPALHALETLDLTGNDLQEVPGISALAQYPKLKTLILKRNAITSFAKVHDAQLDSSTVESIDLAYNKISTLDVLNDVPHLHSNVRHLRLTGNPVYDNLKSADGKNLTADDGYMLTIARLPQLVTLNYSTITDKERLNAETYYLGQIAAELSKASREQEDSILLRHPRWNELCQEYGEPVIHRRSETSTVIDPDSLAARLMDVTFVLAAHTLPAVSIRQWTAELPKSLNIYAVLGQVGKQLNVYPLDARLIWETGERDPVTSANKNTGPEWWDSDEESEPQNGNTVERHVELVPSTRPIASYITGREARIRVELMA